MIDFLLLFLLLIGCCIVIWRASDGFEIASSYLGRHLSDGVRGATINAIGSSIPELFTTFWFLFALADEDGFAGGIGTTAGSAIFNSMVIPAVVIFAVIGWSRLKAIRVSRRVILRDGLSLLTAEFILIFIISGRELTLYHGLGLMAVYMVYLLVVLGPKREKKEVAANLEDNLSTTYQSQVPWKEFITFNLPPMFLSRKVTSGRMWQLLVVSMLFIGSACLLLVYACERLGEALNIHYYFVAVVIAAAATSVPDTIISYRDAKQGDYDDAIANALGSNIFDICFALGLPLFVYTAVYGPITMQMDVVHNVSEMRVLLFLLTFLAFLVYIIGRYMGQLKAILLLLLYALFTAYIFGRARGVALVDEIGVFLRFWVE